MSDYVHPPPENKNTPLQQPPQLSSDSKPSKLELLATLRQLVLFVGKLAMSDYVHPPPENKDTPHQPPPQLSSDAKPSKLELLARLRQQANRGIFHSRAYSEADSYEELRFVVETADQYQQKRLLKSAKVAASPSTGRDVPLWFSQQTFCFAVCKACSFRTAEEQIAFGSYCADCWGVVRETRKCKMCLVAVEKERLYATYSSPRVCLCRSCFEKGGW